MHARILALMIALALLAGCGGASGPSPTAPPEAPPSPAAEPGAPTSAAPEPTATAEAAGEPTATATAAPAGERGDLRLALESVAEGFRRPVYVTHAGDGSGRLFVVEQAGRILIVRDGQPAEAPFLDIVERVGSQGNEQGLLSVAFHPRFAENGLLFVNYTDRDGDTVVSRFTAQGDAADPASEKVLLQVDQPYANHNGGLVLFGPDGFLYIGLGDGGSAGDPQGNGQDPDTLLGKLLRIDVDGGDPYAIPPDNPWAQGGGRPEAWATGLRNPWRFSFDRETGDLFIADVGQNSIEEINFQAAGSPSGQNYGWNRMEGTECFRSASCDAEGLVTPIAEYGHEQGCSVTGGYVYRGAAFPAMQGAYFYGDYCSGLIWALRQAEGGWQQTLVLESDARISSFGEDEAGELYLTDLGGTLYRVVPAPA